ncbi:glycosyltransferase family 8 protein, partial [Phlebiopsis gigantea 11061_1 CR5-6]
MARNSAYVTLLTKTEYLAGALVLHKSLVDAGSKYPLVVMITPPVPQDVRMILRRHGMDIVEVESLLPREGSHALAAHDIRFQDTWTKLRAFGLVHYERVVMLDSDMIVMRNMDELM